MVAFFLSYNLNDSVAPDEKYLGLNEKPPLRGYNSDMVAKKPLYQFTEKELHQALEQQVANYLQYSYNDYSGELERRRQQRNADRVFKLSIVAIIVSVISLFGSLLTALLR